ncbi:hypothetical protein HNQ51_000960 [Inhella inkyongensis]|uniref:Purine nucleoside phosphorylase n=1 Tax=Inhella inkyongensis TaxID=392593 RepID=A0A840RY78_9BURK|nr:peptidoglycan editing factor PgeF [Inhella inkyongensis]MBB5203667.1 hypothetical protein [Inhella inkyongensis]
MLTTVDLGAGVCAAYSGRAGGVSHGGYASLNLGTHVGDAPEAVQVNRARVAQALGAVPVYLRQVHGTVCVAAQVNAQEEVEADALWTAQPGLPLAIQVADCLPVLFVVRDAAGQALAVAAVHAGWRGLAAGVLEATLAALPQGSVQAWLGPCIGLQAFEVGEEVLRGFGRSPADPGPHFVWAPRPDGSARWRADLQGLARLRLQAAGVHGIQVEPACTFSEPSRFFSFRRDGAISGRQAVFIQLA